ncbi:hypothetical protein [Streptomyces lydicus]|uniref:hypothetical protein n=1 Tax=Streptomyces lydicus TaxID=47763 RepID=UPI0037B1D2E5
MRFNTFDGAGPVLSWNGWRDVPDGVTPSAPSITDFGAGYFLFVRGTNDGIHYKSLGADRASWGVWNEVSGGGRTFDAPAVARSLLVVRGTDDQLHYNAFDGGSNWAGWHRAEGGTFSAPALTHAGGFFALVVRGVDDSFHSNFYD